MAKISKDNLERLIKIKSLLKLSEIELKLLSNPAEVNKATLNVAGKQYKAWRIVFNRALGPGKGGIRFHQEVNQEEVASLAFWMSIKNSLADIPYGGAKGGVRVNPKQLSDKQKEELSRQYVAKLYKHLGQDKDIPAPDVYTNSQVMAWMLDEFEKQTGKHEPGMITGKPIDLGGIALRQDATARGAYIISKQIIKKHKLKPSFAIQGFGNAGSFFAQMATKDAYKVVAVSDSQGAVYNNQGLNIKKLVDLKSQGKSVIDYKQAKQISNQELLNLKVDFLALAALENQIHQDNAEQVRAKYIIELANGPVTNKADQILFDNNIILVPDILANAGGVIVSYFEWAQNRTGNVLDNDYLAKLLETKMKNNWQRVQAEQAKYKDIDLRTAAYLLAVKRILSAERFRGNIK